MRVHVKDEGGEVLRRYEEMLKGAQKTTQGADQPKSAGAEQSTKAAFDADPDKALRNGIRYKLLAQAKDYERKLLENTQSRKYRSEHQLFVAEGYRIIREALQHGATPEAVYFSRLKLVSALRASPSKLTLEDVHALSDLPLIRAPYKTLQTWSSVTTSPGIVGVFKIPTSSSPSPHTTTASTKQPLTLVLDELREPSNLGGVLRTAAAVGVTQVLLLKGCCDPWETKVVRAGCGAHFRLRLTPKVTWDTLTTHVPEDAQIFLADVCRAEDLLEDSRDEVEGERHATNTDRQDVNSLGSLSENLYELDEEGNKVLVDLSYNDPQHLELYSNVRLPTLSYDRLGLRGSGGRGAVLVIGGETGVSNAAKKFVADNSGSKVTVPLANGMDSLNVGVASGVILYAMQRQLHEIATQMEKARFEGGG